MGDDIPNKHHDDAMSQISNELLECNSNDEFDIQENDFEEKNQSFMHEDTSQMQGDTQKHVAFVPYVGQVFPNVDTAYEFYNNYAKHTGFGVRNWTTRKSKITGNLISKEFVCSKEGTTFLNDKRQTGKEVKRKRTTRTGCLAKMIIHVNEGIESWVVTNFEEAHNHPLLVSPSQIGKQRSHKKLHRTQVVKSLIDDLHGQGLAPSTISKVLTVQYGSVDEIVTAQQCQDHLRIRRKNNMGRECVSVIKHFQDKKANDLSFYFAMELDDDHSLRSVFWADGRSISSYLQFGDVVVFDVTYRTNKFSMPFAPFTGVNHHSQSILFGCALLADETEETFVWLFEQWLKCMCGKQPGAIITDQDGAICNAIKRVFPETHHRYCSWHINKHVMEHLHLIRLNQNGFSTDYETWFKSNSILESERSWECLKEKYSLQGNSWLMKMYELRHHWVPAYLKGTFTAGMTSSQRSESINAFFDGYVNAMTPLNDFVMQYDNAVKDRRRAEKDEDFYTLNSKPIMESSLPIEAQAGKCYTRKMFNKFQEEFRASSSYWKERLRKDGPRAEYIVGYHSTNKSKWRTVVYDCSGDSPTLTCSCAKFETKGMLCRHILYIMRNKQVERIPERYILRRWTIDSRYRVGTIGGGVGGSNDTSSQNEVTNIMMWSLRCKHMRLLEEASSSITLYTRLNSFAEKEIVELEAQKKAAAIDPLSQVDSNVLLSQTLGDMPEISVRDPRGPITTKGRPRVASRFKGGKEVAQQQKEKQQRKCHHCQEKGHYKNGCRKLKAEKLVAKGVETPKI